MLTQPRPPSSRRAGQPPAAGPGDPDRPQPPALGHHPRPGVERDPGRPVPRGHGDPHRRRLPGPLPRPRAFPTRQPTAASASPAQREQAAGDQRDDDHGGHDQRHHRPRPPGKAQTSHRDPSVRGPRTGPQPPGRFVQNLNGRTALVGFAGFGRRRGSGRLGVGAVPGEVAPMRRAIIVVLTLALLLPVGLLARGAAADPVDVPGLEGPARVDRDGNGIAHIRAGTRHDLFFLQGWVHAQDRLFQMDVRRRQAGGTLAELLGPAALPTDVQLRTIGLHRAAARSLPALSGRRQGGAGRLRRRRQRLGGRPPAAAGVRGPQPDLGPSLDRPGQRRRGQAPGVRALVRPRHRAHHRPARLPAGRAGGRLRRHRPVLPGPVALRAVHRRLDRPRRQPGAPAPPRRPPAAGPRPPWPPGRPASGCGPPAGWPSATPPSRPRCRCCARPSPRTVARPAPTSGRSRAGRPPAATRCWPTTPTWRWTRPRPSTRSTSRPGRPTPSAAASPGRRG